MARFWNRGQEPNDLETMLRTRRPEPSRDLADGIAERIRAHRPQGGFARVRIAFAAGLSVAMLTALASVGGLGYAASSAEGGFKAAKKIVSPQKHGRAIVNFSPSSNQYKTTICHKTGSAKNPYVEITVSNNALPAHQAHGDIIPAPPSGCPRQ